MLAIGSKETRVATFWDNKLRCLAKPGYGE